ncbi:hypothetical protein N0V82_008998 [Gnomoniopsis sp. IMI 355080]|nr:hypothetical protein N0V82_008998 [Gnomoniopsis sp. IMI 355080]
MKSITATISTLAVLGAVMAQAPTSLPQCGQTCINNLLADASSFGCTAGGDGEAACLCANADFTYGIRDCSNEACGDAASASSAIAYGISYCSCKSRTPSPDVDLRPEN